MYFRMPERLRIAQLCKGIGLAIDTIKQLFKESKDSDRLKLSINGQNIIDWFREQFSKLRQTIRPHIKPAPPTPKKGRGI
ncbi:hypothetical protein [Dysgonomonas sp. 25]|uniref:hypothetical protein n=1 Tax=Dysgonomonas sp. 25 TaxID=2302933 RepID=UPI001625E1BE|nr:hypothetical protein [Dysgonomonas sp. 25]